MNYNSTINIKLKKPKELLKIFQPELKNSINDRSNYKIQEKKDSLNFIIFAKDSVSLRSVLNSITKLLTIYEKLHKNKDLE